MVAEVEAGGDNPLKEALEAIETLADDEEFKEENLSRRQSVEEEERTPVKKRSLAEILGRSDSFEVKRRSLEKSPTRENKENEDRNNIPGQEKDEEVIEEPFVERIYPMLGSKLGSGQKEEEKLPEKDDREPVKEEPFVEKIYPMLGKRTTK